MTTRTMLRIMWSVVMVTALCCTTVVATAADDAPPPAAAEVTQLLRIERADVNEVAEMLAMFPGSVRPNRELGVIAWTGPERLADAVSAAAEELDVPPTPPANLELTVYVVAAAEGEELPGGLPEALAPVATQLEEVLGLESFELLETASLRVRDGEGVQSSGGLRGRDIDRYSAQYSLRVGRVTVDQSDGVRARLDRVDFGAKIPFAKDNGGHGVSTTTLETNLDLTAGQLAVVGRANVPGRDESLLLVISADIVD